jgi:hypothetical protein
VSEATTSNTISRADTGPGYEAGAGGGPDGGTAQAAADGLLMLALAVRAARGSRGAYRR